MGLHHAISWPSRIFKKKLGQPKTVAVRKNGGSRRSRIRLAEYRIDFSAPVSNNRNMNVAEKITGKDARLERIITGKPLDLEVYRRIREKRKRITDELRQPYGEMDIAVELIREVREEL